MNSIQKELERTKKELAEMPASYQFAFIRGARYGVLAESINAPEALEIIEETDDLISPDAEDE